METVTVDRKTLNMITSLAHQLHTSEMAIVKEALACYAQKTEQEDSRPLQGRGKKQNLLQVGAHKSFKPFTPIKMTGEGPTASEMVIQDRE